ncbi:MAG: hypothetical protein ACOC53_08365 [Candidatus Saliniplasma sp.]
MPWDKILAGFVVILIIALAVGSAIPSGSGGEANFSGVTELTLVVENSEKDTSESLTLEIPGTIGLTREFFQEAGILDNPSAFTTITDPDKTWGDGDTIKMHAVADIWWSSENMDSVDAVGTVQTGTLGGDDLYYESGGSKHTEIAGSEDVSQLERSEDDPVSVHPNGYFDSWGTDIERTLEAQHVNEVETIIDLTAKVEGTDLNGNTVQDTIDVEATVELDVQEDGSLSIGAELKEAETTSQ